MLGLVIGALALSAQPLNRPGPRVDAMHRQRTFGLAMKADEPSSDGKSSEPKPIDLRDALRDRIESEGGMTKFQIDSKADATAKSLKSGVSKGIAGARNASAWKKLTSPSFLVALPSVSPVLVSGSSFALVRASQA